MASVRGMVLISLLSVLLVGCGNGTQDIAVNGPAAANGPEAANSTENDNNLTGMSLSEVVESEQNTQNCPS